MMAIPTELALSPLPFFHEVRVRDHRIFVRLECACGWKSQRIFGLTRYPIPSWDHPHRLVTVSRTDFTPIPHPSNGPA